MSVLYRGSQHIRESVEQEPMSFNIRPYEARDFTALYNLDQTCFVPGISYSKWVLHYYLHLPDVDCLVAFEGKSIFGFILGESNPPLGHIITLDVAESHRRAGLGTALLTGLERNFVFRGVRTVLLESAVDNDSGIAFWKRHGYCTEAVLKRYYLRKTDAYEMRKKLALRQVDDRE